ncbi:MAG TPA: hypothetical protein VKT81_06175, partial [Bryobacteraceae bacterium]|nr:hypothetical protein [Bryobacteraceae bacterium]
MSASWTRRGFLNSAAAAGFAYLLPRCACGAPVPFPVHYRKPNPYEKLRPLIEPGHDAFPVEAEAVEIAARWKRGLATGSISLAEGFRGSSPMPARYRGLDAEFDPS